MQNRYSLFSHEAVRSTCKHCGFTLVEMLVVVAILGVLIALAFPVMGLVLNKASIAAASSNMRQLATVFEVYGTEHGTLPEKVFSGQRIHTRRGLGADMANRLYSYMGLSQPGDEWESHPIFNPPAAEGWVSQPHGHGFNISQEILMPDGTPQRTFGKYNEDTSAMKLALLSTVENRSRKWAVWELGGAGDPAGDAGYTEPMHGKSRVVLFFDWHVEAVPADVLPTDWQ